MTPTPVSSSHQSNSNPYETAISKMTLQEKLSPHQGVTVLDPVDDKSTFTDRTNFQVLKKGKPFTKLATNELSPRMTRDAYFKIAEARNLSSMRDDMASIMGSSAMTATI